VSRENVEVVRRGFDAWNAGDMDHFRDLYDPHVVMQTVPDWPEPGPYVGREAVIGFFARLRDSLDSDAVEPMADFIEVADHVLIRQTWRGLGHGPDMNMPTTAIYTLRRGKIIYLEYFWDHADALKAVGLEA
jgi:ketosteroid isomerase-like protein